MMCVCVEVRFFFSCYFEIEIEDKKVIFSFLHFLLWQTKNGVVVLLKFSFLSKLGWNFSTPQLLEDIFLVLYSSLSLSNEKMKIVTSSTRFKQ